MEKVKFLEKVESFLQYSQVSPTMFGKLAVGCPKFVFNLRKGMECREKRRNKVLKFMEEYNATNENNKPQNHND